MRQKTAMADDTIPKRKSSLSFTILFLTVIAIVATSAVSTVIPLLTMGSIVNEATASVAKASVDVLRNEIDARQESAASAVSAIALNQAVLDAITSGGDILAITDAMTADLDFDNLIVTDSDGKVLSCSTDLVKPGEDISSRDYVLSACKGERFSGIAAEPDVTYAIIGAAPIYDAGGRIAGTVSALYSLAEPGIVDELKAETGNEFTIFLGDTRLNTTIIKDGERAVGTVLNPAVADIVINKKQEYFGEAEILGETYATAYLPVLSGDGRTVTGILFSGSSMADIERLEKNVRQFAFAACLTLILVVSFIGVVFMRKRLQKPLWIVVSAAQQIEAGTMGPHTLEMLKSIQSRDEMGMLARSMDMAIRSVGNVLTDIRTIHETVTNHDLSVNVDTASHSGQYREIMILVEGLISRLGGIICNIRSAAGVMSANADSISTGAQSLAQGAAEQAATIEEISATVSEVVGQTKKTLQSAVAAKEIAENVQKEARKGSEKMERMMTALEGISAASSNISSIIKAIEDIAFQTNILALNASVEAARAGIHGKGFAVVAEEVKNLSSKSAEAAKETNDLISASVSKSKEGARIGEEMRQSLEDMIRSINDAVLAVNEIAGDAKCQAENIEEVNVGLDQISQVVQSNTSMAEQSANASRQMSEQAGALNDMVSQFKIKNN